MKCATRRAGFARLGTPLIDTCSNGGVSGMKSGFDTREIAPSVVDDDKRPSAAVSLSRSLARDDEVVAIDFPNRDIGLIALIERDPVDVKWHARLLHGVPSCAPRVTTYTEMMKRGNYSAIALS
jgi:hypothetical protein